MLSEIVYHTPKLGTSRRVIHPQDSTAFLRIGDTDINVAIRLLR